MCGIVGIVSKYPVRNRLIEGLRRLEYRGYDSAGIAVLVKEASNNNQIQVRRAVGKLNELAKLVEKQPIDSTIGIGHTRWATHGKVTEENAHPHFTDNVVVVHNGIIENFSVLKDRLQAEGVVFKSQTDTEVIAQLVNHYFNAGMTALEAFKATLKDLEGAFAIAVMVKGYDDLLFIARQGSPLVIGRGDGENMIGSDAISLASWVKDVQYLEDGDYALISRDQVQIFDRQGQIVDRPIQQTSYTGDSASKGQYDHFMLKEIYEQPETVKNTILSFVDESTYSLKKLLPIDWKDVSRLTIVACGTSFYAASVAKYWFEMIAKLPVDVDIASEFRYREPVLAEKGVALFISQSGETIDTLMALNLATDQNQTTIGLVNVPESSIVRKAQHVLFTQAGPEIGVASTKAFTAQMSVLACLSVQAAFDRGYLSEGQAKKILDELLDIPTECYHILQKAADMEKIAHEIKDSRDVIYLGRGTNYCIAQEGALKLKEISYIHAEACAAGEIKHGPIALIDDSVPVIVIAPSDRWMGKTLSNLQEVTARGGRVICLTDAQGRQKLEEDNIDCTIVDLPIGSALSAPIMYTIPLQLLAYYTALLRGADVDQPRNLAKSVTVE